MGDAAGAGAGASGAQTRAQQQQQQGGGFYANANSPIASAPNVARLRQQQAAAAAASSAAPPSTRAPVGSPVPVKRGWHNAGTLVEEDEDDGGGMDPRSRRGGAGGRHDDGKSEDDERQAGDENQPMASAGASASAGWGAALLSPVLSLWGSSSSAPTTTTGAAATTLETEEDSYPTRPLHEIDDNDEEEEYEEEDSAASAAAAAAAAALQHFLEFDPFVFIAQLPPYHTVQHGITALRGLPPLDHRSKRYSLVLDLDETLVHCSSEPTPNYDITFTVEFNGASCQVYVKKRPHLDEFLEAVSRMFEVTVFTASQRVYAERLLDILDPRRRLIHHRLYRESCLYVQGNLLKDLNVLSRDLTKTIIVDNSIHAFGYHTCNGIPIESWFDDEDDTELLKLLPFLEKLSGVADVRPHIRESFGVGDLVRRAAESLRLAGMHAASPAVTEHHHHHSSFLANGGTFEEDAVASVSVAGVEASFSR